MSEEEMPGFSTEGMSGPTGYANTDRVATSILVDADPMANWATLARIVVPCNPGDVFQVYGEARITDDIGPELISAGIGLRLGWYWYDPAQPSYGAGNLAPIPTSTGTNVDRSLIHHVQLSMQRWWIAPATRPDGVTRVAFRLIGDAHSSIWDRNGGGDRLTVDDMTVISVLRWTNG